MRSIAFNDNKGADETHVYIISHGSGNLCTGPVKIGIARDCRSRLAAIQTGNPHDLDIVVTFPMPDRRAALAAERAFHTVMRDHKMMGEWFDLSVEDAIATMCQNLSAMFRLHFQAGTDDEYTALSEACGVVAACQYLFDLAASKHLCGVAS